LRAVLQCLRDRLTIDEAAQLGDQLPMLVCGNYEARDPAGKPKKIRTREDFLALLATRLAYAPVVPEDAARAVFQVLEKHVAPGEVSDVIQVLPQEDMLDLAVHIIETKAGHFPSRRNSRIITRTPSRSSSRRSSKKKQRGEKVEKRKEYGRAQVVNLMDALRQSAALKRRGARSQPPRNATDHRRTPANRPNVRSRKAG
jgi:uncharacterized protein (DUF2267 family)